MYLELLLTVDSYHSIIRVERKNNDNNYKRNEKSIGTQK